MRLEITEPAEKDLIKLDRKNQRRIGAALDRLLTYPQAVDLKKTPWQPGKMAAEGGGLTGYSAN